MPLPREVLVASIEELLGRPLNDVEQKNAPKQLWIGTRRGVPLPGPRTAIVGTRKPSKRGIEAADEIASFLAKKKVVVVSGLAEGIDTAAHEATIREGGPTIAVIGTALDKSYPAKNSKLQETIMQKHWVVSQFQPGHPTQRRNFVMRDWTMALIADASIIVEAGETSGAMYEGWETLRLGRPLFLWTELLEDPSLKWPGEMLDYGAVSLLDLDDVMDSLPSSNRILEITF